MVIYWNYSSNPASYTDRNNNFINLFFKEEEAEVEVEIGKISVKAKAKK